MATRTIYLADPLFKLGSLLGSGGKFSSTINSLVDRYFFLCKNTPLPQFSDIEIKILKKTYTDGDFSSFKIKVMHLAVKEVRVGTQAQRDALSEKLKNLSMAQKLLVFDYITEQPFYLPYSEDSEN